MVRTSMPSRSIIQFLPDLFFFFFNDTATTEIYTLSLHDAIPIVPHYLAWRLREYGYSAQLIEAAHEVNARMPMYVVQKVGDALNEAGKPIKGSKILLLGVAYKADVHDTRESPSFEIMRQLIARGGDISYCDPWVAEFELDGVLHSSVEWSAERVAQAECVVLLTPH